MSARQLPLLCHNTDVYRGPFVPTEGLKGHVHAEGLVEQDLLQVIGLYPAGGEEHLGELTKDVSAVIFNSKAFEYVRAVRVHSSGNPITVWVA